MLQSWTEFCYQLCCDRELLGIFTVQMNVWCVEVSFSQISFNNVLNCLKKLDIVFKTLQACPQWRTHLKRSIQLIHLFWLKGELQLRVFLNLLKFLSAAQNQCLLPMSFLRSTVVAFYQDNATPHTAARQSKPYVNSVENIYNILFTTQIQPLLSSTRLAFLKKIRFEHSFPEIMKWWVYRIHIFLALK